MIIAALLSGKTLFCCWLCRKTHVLICTQAFTNILDLTEKVTETNNIVLLTEKEEPYFNSNSLPFTLGPSDLAPRIKVLRQRQEQLQMSRQESEMLLSDRREGAGRPGDRDPVRGRLTQFA